MRIGLQQMASRELLWMVASPEYMDRMASISIFPSFRDK